MKHYSIIVEAERCTGCYSCTVACQQENHLPADMQWIRVVTSGPRKAGDKLVMDVIPTFCTNCSNAPCKEVCPTDAIKQRADGIVLIDEELCSGCKLCIEACPFSAIQYDQRKNIVTMCTLCVHRIDEGLEPSCVKHCIGGALKFGEVSDAEWAGRKA